MCCFIAIDSNIDHEILVLDPPRQTTAKQLLSTPPMYSPSVVFLSNHELMSGLEHQFYFPINIGNVIIPID